MGTAIGAIHRLRPNFLQAESYPVFSTGQIRAQLTAWIKRLRQAGHVPPEITSSWGRIIETEGLWSFVTCPVHGGFSDGDVLFSRDHHRGDELAEHAGQRSGTRSRVDFRQA